jgi:hypothetical protein
VKHSVSRRFIHFALLITTAASLLCLWNAWCEFPIYSWNEMRLAPAFALRHGINPYPLIGDGPLFTWIYGPVGILINLPATFASSVEGALRLNFLINLVVLTSPLALIFFQAKDFRQYGRTVRWLALALTVLLIPRPNLVLQVADHAAIAFGLLSCWFLSRSFRPSGMELALAAGSCVLATWSKQITVALIFGQLAYLVMIGARNLMGKYVLWLTLLGLLSLGGTVWAFGWQNLWLNLVVIPSRLDWTDDIVGRITMRYWTLIAQIGLPCAGLTALWGLRHWPNRETENGRFFLLTIIAYFAMLPIGLAAYFKVGGDTNLLHSWAYLLPGLLLAWLANAKTTPKMSYHLLAVTIASVALRWSDVSSPASGPFNEHFKVADKLMAAHPHRIWFPRNPLITFYADDRLWHSEDGIETRFLANYGIREPDFQRHLPPNLEGVVYPYAVTDPFSIHLLSPFSQITRMQFWTLYTHPETAQTKP